MMRSYMVSQMVNISRVDKPELDPEDNRTKEQQIYLICLTHCKEIILTE